MEWQKKKKVLPDGERRSIRIFLSRESQCRQFSVALRLPDACGLHGLDYRRDEPNVYCMRLYRINVNRYACVSCSSFKPLMGAAWRGMHMSPREGGAASHPTGGG